MKKEGKSLILTLLGSFLLRLFLLHHHFFYLYNSFFIAGKAKLNYAADKKVYVVLEEDGTEVDEEEYFQTLPANTLLMILFVGDRWSPFGPPFT